MYHCTYLLPIRRALFNADTAEELRCYLNSVRRDGIEIIVVDGSPADVFAAHARLWAIASRHLPVDRQYGFLNDKVNGIYTGLHRARSDKIVLADDDIRYRPDQVVEIAGMLDRFDVVRPQNFFRFRRDSAYSDATAEPDNSSVRQPLWAKTEAARMLINRATLRTGDYPGTCAFRRQMMLRSGSYDGDVLFDNEELIRHLARAGAQICYANNLFVEKRPPIFRKWIEQRPRQAYEDFGLRLKTILFAALPIAAIASAGLLGATGFLATGLAVAAASVFLAFCGRARGRAAQFFPLHICFFAPLWIFERSLSTYWAFYWRLRKGGYPFGDRLLQKGIGRDWVEGGRIASRMVNSRANE
jgi:hypothetical protein